MIRIRSMHALVASFPCLSKTPASLLRPGFDAERFARFWMPGSYGEKLTARFVLSVWNPHEVWVEFGLGDHGVFDVHAALKKWDDPNLAAFLAWAKDPWWP